MALLSFLNSGVVILLINFKLESMSDSSVPLLKGEYKKFSSEWYRLVGSTICLTVIFMAIMPHVANMSMQVMFCTKRCWDRRCTCDLKKTRKLTQWDYEDVNTGNEFMLEFRYSNVLSILAVIFSYSSAMPILYAFGALFFLITYWIDKWLLFHYYKKPVMFDSHVARKSLSLFKYILLLHCGGFIVMFSNSEIFPLMPKNDDKDEPYQRVYQGDAISDKVSTDEIFRGKQTQIYIAVLFVACFVYALYKVFFQSCFKCIEVMCCSDKTLQVVKKENVATDSNFYNCISFVTLRQELYLTVQSLEVFIDMYRKNSYNEVYLSSNELKQYIQLQINQKEEIIRRIKTIGESKLGMNAVSKIDGPVALITRLNDLERQGLLSESKIKDELQSYDILRNPVYSRLCELKNVLDFNRG